MPFDFAAPLALIELPAEAVPMPSPLLHGVPRPELVDHALAQIAPALRGAVADIELTDAGPFTHMGVVFDRIAWRATWRRPGMPVASGSFPVWNGSPV